MSKPKRQHFIPQSYLRNFAIRDKDKAFVEVMNIDSGEMQFPFSVKNLCVSKNLYTLPHLGEEDKYRVEHFYAENVDAIYPEVYELLTNDLVVKISDEDRMKILSTTLSLYFRTPIFLDSKNTELDQLLERAMNLSSKDDSNLFIVFEGRKYTFKRSEIASVKETAKADNKLAFILGHLEDWQNFVQHKNNSQITVCKVIDDLPLITCDNPVDIYNSTRSPVDLFDVNNSIQLPLDQKHFLWISPNTENCERNIIYRGVRDRRFALTANLTVQKNASEWIIGNYGTILTHLESQRTFNENMPENVKAAQDMGTLAEGLTAFSKFIDENGGITSEKSLERLRELLKNPVFANDPEVKIISEGLVQKGYDLDL